MNGCSLENQQSSLAALRPGTQRRGGADHRTPHGRPRHRPLGEEPTFHAPCFVITHRPADTISKRGGTSYIFVTQGIEAALERAQQAAGSRDILVNGGADIGRQFLNAGLLDQLRLHLVPVILGEGTRLLDGVMASVRLIPREARNERIVTHLAYDLERTTE